MKLSVQIILALCLTYFMTSSEAAIKKASYQELKKIIISDKSRVPNQEIDVLPRKTSITGIPSIKMSYVDTADFRQVVKTTTTESPISTTTTKKIHIPIFDLRDEASANLKAFPYVEVDRNSRFTTSIVFGIGGSNGFGF